MERVLVLNRDINNYLKSYSNKYFENVLRDTFIYGINSLCRDFNERLNPEELKQVVGLNIFIKSNLL
jgi:hypothetical protein